MERTKYLLDKLREMKFITKCFFCWIIETPDFKLTNSILMN